jgi:hypothetical protein
LIDAQDPAPGGCRMESGAAAEKLFDADCLLNELQRELL